MYSFETNTHLARNTLLVVVVLLVFFGTSISFVFYSILFNTNRRSYPVLTRANDAIDNPHLPICLRVSVCRCFPSTPFSPMCLIFLIVFILLLVSSRAVDRNCINAQHPDSYGHYREAKYTQTKHHWFWKVRDVS